MHDKPPTSIAYEFGEFRLLPAEHALLRGDERIPLTPRVFELLLKLVENAGHLLEKERLMAEIWSDAIVEEANLNRTVSRLRNLLGEKKNENRYIETIPWVGYRFVAEVKTVDLAETSSTDVAAGEVVPDHETPARPTRLFVGLATGLLAAIIVGAFAWYASSSSAEVPRKIKSIAVLPFRALTDNENDRILGLGLTDSLITKLGGLGQLVVRPTTSISRFADGTPDPVDTGKQLNVDAVLEGSILQAEGRMRVNIRLLDSRTGEQIWADRFESAFTDVFDLEDRISETTARRLLSKLGGEPGGRVTKRYTESAEAFEAYLKGRYFLNKRNEEGFRQAIGYFNEAAAKDPNYALAYAGLADCYILLGVWGTTAPNEVFPQARQAAEKALQIDRESAEALVSLAFVEWVHGWEFQKADTDFRRAIDLNPNYATAHHWYAYFLVSQGRGDEAIAEIKKARELEGPLSLSVNTDIGEIYSWAGRYDEAERYFQDVLRIEPNYAAGRSAYGINLIKQNRLDESITELERARDLESSPRILAVLGYAYAMTGEKDKARGIIRELEELSNHRYVSSFSRGIVYVGLGETDEALACFENAYQERSDTIAIINVYPLLDSLKANVRFVNLLRRVGLG